MHFVLSNLNIVMLTVDSCNCTCAMSTTNGERSEYIKSRTELNPGHVPEVKDCPGISRMDGDLTRQGACQTVAFQSPKSLATRQHLCSAARHQLTVPLHRLGTFGRRAFAVSGPTMFNAMSDELRDPAVSITTFGDNR